MKKVALSVTLKAKPGKEEDPPEPPRTVSLAKFVFVTFSVPAL